MILSQDCSQLWSKMFKKIEGSYISACSVGRQVIGTPFEAPCFGERIPVSSFSEEDAKLLHDRCSAVDQDQINRGDICETHHYNLGKGFFRKYISLNVCFWPAHKGKRYLDYSHQMKPISTKMSKNALNFLSVSLPVGGLICNSDYIHMRRAVLKAMEASGQGSSTSTLVSLQPSSTSSLPSNHPSSTWSLPSAPSFNDHMDLDESGHCIVEFEDPPEDPVKTLNKLLEENHFSTKCRFRLNKIFVDAASSTQREVKRVLASAVVAAIHTVSANPDDDSMIWEALKSSDLVEKYLSSPKNVDTLLSEIILAYNDSTSFREKIQLLSILPPRYSYSKLAIFNKKVDIGEDGDQAMEVGDITEDEDDLEEFHDILLHGPKWDPPLSRHLYNKAKHHYYRNNRGFVEVSAPSKQRMKLSSEVVALLFDFITSPAITQNVAYGTISVHDESGVQKTLPKVIRTKTKAELVRLCQSFLSQQAVPVPCERTIFRFLRELPAASPKIMRGINSAQEDGMGAFEKLKGICIQLQNHGIQEKFIKPIIEALSTLLAYVRNYFPYSLSMTSSVAAHCVTHGLSDGLNKQFASECEFDHTEECHYCSSLGDVIDGIQGLIQMGGKNFLLSPDELNELEFDTRLCHEHIVNYKKHLMQDFAQSREWDLIGGMKDDTIAICVVDWAMKWIPAQFRESQRDWFGKAGIPWHITVFEHFIKSKDGSWSKKISSHVSIMTNSENQESCVNVALLKTSLSLFSKANPQIKKCYIRSDNAGTYHSENFLLPLYFMRNSFGNMKIVKYVFSTPGAGKSKADSIAAIMKRKAWTYISQGHKAVTPMEFAVALTMSNPVANVLVLAGKVVDIKKLPQKRQIKSIMSLNEFTFLHDGIKVKKQSGVGEGQLIKVNKVEQTAVYDCSIIMPDGSRVQVVPSLDPNLCHPPKEVLKHLVKRSGAIEEVEGYEDSAEDIGEATSMIVQPVHFQCPNSHCSAEFLTFKRFEEHVANGICQVHLPSQNATNRLRKAYFSKYGLYGELDRSSQWQRRHFQTNLEQLKRIELPSDLPKALIPVKTSFEIGFALSKKKSHSVFNAKQESFVLDAFNQGQASGQKSKAADVARLMRTTKDPDGSPLFTIEEWLSESQIKGLFAKYLLRLKKGSHEAEETTQAIEEVQSDMEVLQESKIRRILLANVNSNDEQDKQHPIQACGIELCALAKDFKNQKKKRVSQFFGIEKSILIRVMEAFSIPFPKKMTHGNISTALTKYVEENCSDACLVLE